MVVIIVERLIYLYRLVRKCIICEFDLMGLLELMVAAD